MRTLQGSNTDIVREHKIEEDFVRTTLAQLIYDIAELPPALGAAV